jgi:hypothetical protein
VLATVRVSRETAAQLRLSREDGRCSPAAIAYQAVHESGGANWFVWAPEPAAGRTYDVTVTIRQPRKGDVDVPLADFDTAEFRELSGRQAATEWRARRRLRMSATRADRFAASTARVAAGRGPAAK